MMVIEALETYTGGLRNIVNNEKPSQKCDVQSCTTSPHGLGIVGPCKVQEH